MIHKVAFLAGAVAVKGLFAAGHLIGHALAANPDVVVGKAIAVPLAHAAAAHPAAAAFTGAALAGLPIVTIAYLDVAEANRQLAGAGQGVTSSRNVKLSVAGNLIRGEFSSITGPFEQGNDLVLLGNYDQIKQKMTKAVLLKPKKVEERFSKALAGGNVLALAA
jgi:hypothetical protein